MVGYAFGSYVFDSSLLVGFVVEAVGRGSREFRVIFYDEDLVVQYGGGCVSLRLGIFSFDRLSVFRGVVVLDFGYYVSVDVGFFKNKEFQFGIYYRSIVDVIF